MTTEISIIKDDSSDIYQFSSPDVSTLDSSWTGKWAVSPSLGEAAIVSGELVKNPFIPASGSDPEVTADSYFIFQLSPSESEVLNVGKYYLSIQVEQDDGAASVIFRKEVMQAKLIITKQGVLTP